jgi:CubicO group peptidase (beta-lactamase class C family)
MLKYNKIETHYFVKKINGEKISISELDTVISGIMEKAGVTGLSCAIFDNSEIVYLKSFGFKDKGKDVKNNEETNFSAASFSKTVFAYLVMVLAEEGIIDLDKPLAEYWDKPIQEYPDYVDLEGDSRAGRITARMVLSHSTGFPNWRYLTVNRKLKIMFEPGSRFSYSGEGFRLLQIIIEKITGKELEELSQGKVFKPMGMERTSYVWQEKYEENHAVPHDQYERSKLLRRRREADAAGSLQTTAGDYARFILEILNARGKRETTMQAMLTPQIDVRSESMYGTGAGNDTVSNDQIKLSWGLGWGIFNSEHGRAFFHMGRDFGWQGYTVTYIDKGIGVVLISNSDNFESAARELTEKTIGDRYSPFDWLGYPYYESSRRREPPPEPAVIEVRPDILKKYIGEYTYLNNRKLFIKTEKNQLYGSYDNEIWVEMNAESESRFRMKDDYARFTFIKNEDGAITGFTLHIEGMEILGEKIIKRGQTKK